MVNTGGQLYTIEGIAAAMILLLTAFIVVNTTSVYTPGDSHISDMQLEVMGSDALRMMNTASNFSAGKTPLQISVEQNDDAAFQTVFLNILNNRTGSQRDSIQYIANVTYVRPDGSVNSSLLSRTDRLYGGEHAVRVSEWVIVEKQFPDCVIPACSGKHAVLVEALLWRN